jgi:hypothetical protein
MPPAATDRRFAFLIRSIACASHAFFDWKPDDTTNATFRKYGVHYAARMKAFFVSVLSAS